MIQRIYDDRKLKTDSFKRIIYFVGGTGCGKTTKVKKLQQTFRGYYQYIMHDEIISFLLSQPNVFTRNLCYLYTLSDRIIATIENAKVSHKNTIFVDGHPMLSLLYSLALFKSQNGCLITEEDLKALEGCYNEIIGYLSGYLQNFHQRIYYINLPLEVNLELIQKGSGCNEVEENEKEEIELIRRTIHSNIFALAEQSGITKVIEVNTLMGLDIVNMYLLGPSTC